MLRRALALGVLPGLLALAQDADFGLNVPATVSGSALYSQRLQLADRSASPFAGAFRAMLYPTLKLGPNWFGYAAIQVRSTPYFYYDAFSPQHRVDTDVLQAFVGYSFRRDGISMVIKAGKLTSAFGAFPLRYDDAENPLLDQPLSYITDLPLDPDDPPTGTNDLIHNYHYGAGPVPVTLYGLPGIQADLSGGRVDARLQLTGGSPASPQNTGVAAQYLQWTVGGGYTIHPGLRVGASGFRGPYLDRSVAPLLPAGTTIRNFTTSGIGVDAQWARGRWSANGELQRFWFDLPYFVVSPSVTSAYVEVKTVITPRFYVAGRAGFLYSGRVVDNSSISAQQFAPYLQAYELAAGYWIARNQLLKGGYEWMRSEGQVGDKTNILGFEYVVQIHPPAWIFR